MVHKLKLRVKESSEVELNNQEIDRTLITLLQLNAVFDSLVLINQLLQLKYLNYLNFNTKEEYLNIKQMPQLLPTMQFTMNILKQYIDSGESVERVRNFQIFNIINFLLITGQFLLDSDDNTDMNYYFI